MNAVYFSSYDFFGTFLCTVIAITQ